MPTLRSRREEQDWRRASLKARRRMPMPTRTPQERRKLWQRFPMALATHDVSAPWSHGGQCCCCCWFWCGPRAAPAFRCRRWSSSMASRSLSSASRSRRSASTLSWSGGDADAISVTRKQRMKIQLFWYLQEREREEVLLVRQCFLSSFYHIGDLYCVADIGSIVIRVEVNVRFKRTLKNN